MLCSSFETEAACFPTPNQWTTHPCQWKPYGSRTESCAENFFSSTSCSSQPTCNRQATGPSQQVQDRTVVCRDNNNIQVSDNYCTHPKPPLTQNATTAMCTGNPLNGVCAIPEGTCTQGGVENYDPSTHTWTCT